jgi:hypothetical protein
LDERSLEGFLGFSDADLAANRDGRLSPDQVARLTWSGIWRLVFGPVLAVGSVVVALAAFTDNAIGTVFALLFVAIGLFLTWMGFAFLADAVDGQVAFVTGPLGCSVVRSKTTSYYANVGPVRKSISSHAYDSLPRIGCHLYYAPGSRSLLSIEPSSESEPKPAHPFGPDSAHVWDRVRASWVAIVVGVLALGIAAYGAAVAHPAQPVRVDGIVSDYYETHGKGGTHRHLLLAGGGEYAPQSEDSYSPPFGAFRSLVGQEIVLYLDQGTSNVIAIGDSDGMHVTDWYAHPDHEKSNLLWNAALSGLAGLAILGGGIAAIAFERWRSGRPAKPAAPVPDPHFAQTPLYWQSAVFVPSARPAHASWAPVSVVALVGVGLWIVIALITTTSR